MTPKELRRRIQRLPGTGPESERLAHRLRRGDKARPPWYRTQKEHWLGWLKEYDGPGAYGRETWEGRTAAFVYNHIQCPPMLLWLAEAAGVPLQGSPSRLSARRRVQHLRPKRRSPPGALPYGP